MDTTEDYRVKTKAERVRADRQAMRDGSGPRLPLAQFMLITYGTGFLTSTQAKVLAEVATWEGVTVTARYAWGKLALTIEGTRWYSETACVRVGKRGRISGESIAIFCGERSFKPSGHGWKFDLQRLAQRVDERGVCRADVRASGLTGS